MRAFDVKLDLVLCEELGATRDWGAWRARIKEGGLGGQDWLVFADWLDEVGGVEEAGVVRALVRLAGGHADRRALMLLLDFQYERGWFFDDFDNFDKVDEMFAWVVREFAWSEFGQRI